MREPLQIVSVTGAESAVVELHNGEALERVDTAFHEVLRTSGRLSDLLQQLQDSGFEFCVFGGWLRDTVSAAATGSPPPRDVDIVVKDAVLKDILKLLPVDVSSTMFGGIQSSELPVFFDIWPLQETFLIKHQRLEKTFRSLLKTADFNINAGLYFPTQNEKPSSMLDGGMLAAISRREIAFNANSLPFPLIQCARIAAYAAKLSFTLAPPVAEFVKSILSDEDNRREVKAGLGVNQPAIAQKAIELVDFWAESNS